MRPQRGNILFLILLAVVLFAALSYAVTEGMRGGGNNAENENSKTGASVILQFLTNLDSALLRMQMSQNISQQNISLVYPYQSTSMKANGTTPSPYFTNANCTTNSCKLFHADGGAASALTFEKYGVADAYVPTTGGGPAPGYYDFIVIAWPGAKTAANDIGMYIQFIAPSVCTALVNMGIPSISGSHVTGYLTAFPVTNWDLTAITVTDTAAQNTLTSQNTFVKFTTVSGPGGNAPGCEIWHLLMAR